MKSVVLRTRLYYVCIISNLKWYFATTTTMHFIPEPLTVTRIRAGARFFGGFYFEVHTGY